MADSASDPKVEDVLSSVRRLVSGEIPRKSRPPLPSGPGALVLTDAHRVVKDPVTRKSSRSLEDRIAELEAAVDDGFDDFEPDGSEDQAQNIPDRVVYTRPPSSDESESVRRDAVRLGEISVTDDSRGEEVSTEEDNAPVPFVYRSSRRGADTRADDRRFIDDDTPEDAPEIEPLDVSSGIEDSEQADLASSESDEAPMAADVPTIPARRAELMAFTNPDDVVERIEARIDRAGEESDSEQPLGDISTPDPSDTQVDASENMLRDDYVNDATGVTDPVVKEALSEAIKASVTAAFFEELASAEEEELRASSDRLVLPEDEPVTEVEDLDLDAAGLSDAEGAEFSDDVLSDEDDVLSEEEAPGEEIAEEPQEHAGGGETGDPEMRALVARLIREELQGELGERITRNVRKLVRREIKRVLEARDII